MAEKETIGGKLYTCSPVFNGAGTILFCALSTVIKAISVETGEPLLRLSGHEDDVTGLLVVPGDIHGEQGDTLLSSSKDGTVRQWDVRIEFGAEEPEDRCLRVFTSKLPVLSLFTEPGVTATRDRHGGPQSSVPVYLLTRWGRFLPTPHETAVALQEDNAEDEKEEPSTAMVVIDESPPAAELSTATLADVTESSTVRTADVTKDIPAPDVAKDIPAPDVDIPDIPAKVAAPVSKKSSKKRKRNEEKQAPPPAEEPEEPSAEVEVMDEGVSPTENVVEEPPKKKSMTPEVRLAKKQKRKEARAARAIEKKLAAGETATLVKEDTPSEAPPTKKQKRKKGKETTSVAPVEESSSAPGKESSAEQEVVVEVPVVLSQEVAETTSSTKKKKRKKGAEEAPIPNDELSEKMQVTEDVLVPTESQVVVKKSRLTLDPEVRAAKKQKRREARTAAHQAKREQLALELGVSVDKIPEAKKAETEAQKEAKKAKKLEVEAQRALKLEAKKARAEALELELEARRAVKRAAERLEKKEKKARKAAIKVAIKAKAERRELAARDKIAREEAKLAAKQAKAEAHALANAPATEQEKAARKLAKAEKKAEAKAQKKALNKANWKERVVLDPEADKARRKADKEKRKAKKKEQRALLVDEREIQNKWQVLHLDLATGTMVRVASTHATSPFAVALPRLQNGQRFVALAGGKSQGELRDAMCDGLVVVEVCGENGELIPEGEGKAWSTGGVGRGGSLAADGGVITAIASGGASGCIATGHTDGRIVIWYALADRAADGNSKSYKHSKLRAKTTSHHWHAHEVACLSFSPDGFYLMSGGEEGVLVQWNLGRGTEAYMPRLGSGLAQVSCSPCGTRTVAASLSNSLTIVELAEWKIRWQFQGLALSCPRDTYDYSNMLRMGTEPESGAIVVNGAPGSLQFYDLNEDRLRLSLEVVPYNRVSRINEEKMAVPVVELFAFSSDGGRLATVDVRCEKKGRGSADRTLKFWCIDRATGKFLLETVVERAHRGRMNCLAYDPSGDRAVTTSEDGVFKIWTLHKKEIEMNTKPAAKARFSGNTQTEQEAIEPTYTSYWVCTHSIAYKEGLAAKCASFSADGSLVAVVFESIITLWKISTHTEVHDMHMGNATRGPVLLATILFPALFERDPPLPTADINTSDTNEYTSTYTSEYSNVFGDIPTRIGFVPGTSHIVAQSDNGIMAWDLVGAASGGPASVLWCFAGARVLCSTIVQEPVSNNVEAGLQVENTLGNVAVCFKRSSKGCMVLLLNTNTPTPVCIWHLKKDIRSMSFTLGRQTHDDMNENSRLPVNRKGLVAITVTGDALLLTPSGNAMNASPTPLDGAGVLKISKPIEVPPIILGTHTHTQNTQTQTAGISLPAVLPPKIGPSVLDSNTSNLPPASELLNTFMATLLRRPGVVSSISSVNSNSKIPYSDKSDIQNIACIGAEEKQAVSIPEDTTRVNASTHSSHRKVEIDQTLMSLFSQHMSSG